jgi:hypothetical protein
MGFRYLRPGPHTRRIRPRKLLHGLGGTAVRIPLSQHRVNRTALHGIVTGLDGTFFVRRGLVRIVREPISLRLKLRDTGFQLRDRGTDVRQLYDVGLPGLHQLAKFRQVVLDPLPLFEGVGEHRQNPTGEGDVTGLNRNPRGRSERTYDRKKSMGR